MKTFKTDRGRTNNLQALYVFAAGSKGQSKSIRPCIAWPGRTTATGKKETFQAHRSPGKIDQF
jgi:hypothetical protein